MTGKLLLAIQWARPRLRNLFQKGLVSTGSQVHELGLCRAYRNGISSHDWRYRDNQL